MSQNKDDKSSASRPGTDASLPKRPVPTIDLKATEIKPETKPAAPSAAAGSTLSGAKPAETKPADQKSAAAPAQPSKGESKPWTAAPASPVVPTVDAKTAARPATGDKQTEPPKPQASAAAAKATSRPPPAAKSTSGIGRALSYMSAAVLGGLIALFGADFLASMVGIDVRPSAPSSTAVDDLAARLAKLERPAGQGASPAVTEHLNQANERIAKLEGANRQLAALSEAQTRLVETTRALETKVGTAPDRVAKLEETIQGLTAMAQSQPGRPLPEMARLTTKLNELDTAVAALRKSGGGEAVAQIDARLAEARKAEAQMTEAMTQLKAESAKRVQEIEAVKTQAVRLEQRVDGVKTDAGTARTTVDALKSDVTAQLQTVARQGDLKATVDVVDKKVAGLETKLEAMSKRDEERQANADRVVAALQLANLKRALDQGKPFGEALADVEKAAGGLIDVAPLRAYREKGVASVTELTTQFRQVARTVLEAEQDKAQTSTVDRLLQSAKSVVQIRRVGADVQGDTAEALLARAEHNLKTGDLDTAAKEMKALKPELRGAAQAWLDQLDARVTVDRALKTIEDKLKTSIAAVPVGGKGGK